MSRRAWLTFAGLAVALAATPTDLSPQPVSSTPPRSASQKIADATSAAPSAIAAQATIMDWPAAPGAEMRELRAGSNGWVCFPSTPQSAAAGGATGADPMCLDAQWQEWAKAHAAKTPPRITRLGIGYMLQGDRGTSNTDPFATHRTADNQWVVSGPHVMVIAPDAAAVLAGMPTTPAGGGPWVMWSGTPYAHVMVPITNASPAAGVPREAAPRAAPRPR